MIQKIKNKWGIENNFQVIIILIVFAVTGSVSAWFSGPLAEYLKLDGLNVLIYWPLRFFNFISYLSSFTCMVWFCIFSYNKCYNI